MSATSGGRGCTETLVILPGLDGTDVFFRPSLKLLPDWIRPLVVCYPPNGSNHYDDLLRLVREQVAGLPNYFVLGSSFSGPLAVMLSAAEPGRVRGVILSATFLRVPTLCLRLFRLASVGPMFWAFRMARRIPVWALQPRDDPFRLAKAETWRRVSARCLAARLRVMLGVDVRAQWRRCAPPTLCLAFADDKVVPRRCAEEILRERPGTRAVSVSGGHLAMCKDPARWTQEVVRFVTDVKESAHGGE